MSYLEQKIKDLDEKYEQRNMFIICQTCVTY